VNFNFLRSLFQNCWNCEVPTWSSYTLCKRCRQHFEFQVTELQGYSNKIEDLPLYFLVYYQYGIEEKLILSLKGAKCSPINFDYVSEILVQQMCFQGLELNNVIWVTPESAHSVEIVKSINKITGLNRPKLVLKEPLAGVRIAQKLKGRSERKRKSFEFLGNSIDKSSNYIFIDDVVATGGTAIAAWYALGKPKFFQIWGLAYRPRLAPRIFV
jgi:predicted amidophosphoribosyltransferase